MRPIIIASPHRRNDSLENQLREKFLGREVVRVTKKSDLNVEALNQIDPEFLFFPHWSWTIPKAIHTQFDCVIFHMTDLPYGRGGSPLQNLIVRGHTDTVLTALKCISELDSGPIYSKRPLSLDGTAEDILRRASDLMIDMAVDIVENHPFPTPQTGQAVEFRRRQPEDGDLSILEEPSQAYDYIRMLDGEGYPPAFLKTPNLHLEFVDATLNEDYVEARVRIKRQNHG